MSSIFSTGTPWTPAEDQILRQLWAEGISSADIARRIGRSPRAVISKAFRDRLRARRMRDQDDELARSHLTTCLSCLKPFAAEWRGNRICLKCKEDHAALGMAAGYDEHSIAF
ncbi:MAG: GcrA family cell cycle regulator [Niveispirillum sp.]|uniref:GcrA family cell cycle regulator n=1 Tax=Niveispirillum sp. TaxID=1917217 RepID=UPI004035FB19